MHLIFAVLFFSHDVIVYACVRVCARMRERARNIFISVKVSLFLKFYSIAFIFFVAFFLLSRKIWLWQLNNNECHKLALCWMDRIHLLVQGRRSITKWIKKNRKWLRHFNSLTFFHMNRAMCRTPRLISFQLKTILFLDMLHIAHMWWQVIETRLLGIEMRLQSIDKKKQEKLIKNAFSFDSGATDTPTVWWTVINRWHRVQVLHNSIIRPLQPFQQHPPVSLVSIHWVKFISHIYLISSHRMLIYANAIYFFFFSRSGNCTQSSSGVVSTAGSTSTLPDLPRYPWMALTGGNYTVLSFHASFIPNLILISFRRHLFVSFTSVTITVEFTVLLFCCQRCACKSVHIYIQYLHENSFLVFGSHEITFHVLYHSRWIQQSHSFLFSKICSFDLHFLISHIFS